MQTQNTFHYRGADSKIFKKRITTNLTIMKKFLSTIPIFLALLIAGCNEPYDDSAIRADIEDLQKRVAALEEMCREMNTNISALQTIVSALQNNDYITNVTPITENGVIIGYTITFAKSASKMQIRSSLVINSLSVL